MKKYDDIVIGSGVSGLSATLLLALCGRKVLLVEKSNRIGGSLSRFYRRGYPFDVGFHFTGALQKGELLYDMLSLLEINELIEPIFLDENNALTFYLESENRIFKIPYGFERLKSSYKDYFPKEGAAIEKYFDLVRDVCRRTSSMDLRDFTHFPARLDEDFISLEEVLGGLTTDPALKAALLSYTMCYGVRPREISFADHCRMCVGAYESSAYVKNGGDGFVNAFKTRFQNLDVEICCGDEISELIDIKDNRVASCILKSGREISSENFIFTIHPQEVLKLLPKRHISKAFQKRIEAFEPSIGFFAVFATLEPSRKNLDSGNSIFSLCPHTDVDKFFDPAYRGEQNLVFTRYGNQADGRIIINILEPSFPDRTAAWSDSKSGRRPESYQEYKKARVEKIKEHIFRVLPHYRPSFEVLESGSMLTFRDYLNSPEGSAYGIKQKIGQYNLLGRTSLRNVNVAGQSAILPGVLGSMMSAIVVGRSIIGQDKYYRMLDKNLCA